MLSISKRLTFSAGHRVFKHESKCANMHGHNYAATIFATAATLDPVGRIIDFSVIKEKIGSWIDVNWDHAFIVFTGDDAAVAALRSVGGRRCAVDFNPTAEQMANYLLRVICPRMLHGTGVLVYRVELEETETCTAIADLESDLPYLAEARS